MTIKNFLKQKLGFNKKKFSDGLLIHDSELVKEIESWKEDTSGWSVFDQPTPKQNYVLSSNNSGNVSGYPWEMQDFYFS